MHDSAYLVFGGQTYYPTGGWHDYKGWHPTEAQAIAVAKTIRGEDTWREIEWVQVVRFPDGEVVFSEGYGYGQPGHTID